MTWKECLSCEHICKCCVNVEYQYVGECDLCVAHDRFRPAAHINYCPNNGLPLNAPKPKVKDRPVVVIGPTHPTREEIEQSMKAFMQSRGEYRL